jgi:hypothetical protein
MVPEWSHGPLTTRPLLPPRGEDDRELGGLGTNGMSKGRRVTQSWNTGLGGVVTRGGDG